MKSLSKVSLVALTLISFQCLGAVQVSAKSGTFRKDRPLNEDIMLLSDRLARNPELMNLKYLRYALGNPSKNAGSYSGASYSWTPRLSGAKNSPTCVLVLQTDQNRQTTGANFNVELPDSDVTLDEVEAREQQLGKKFYDNNSFPAIRFSFQPNTTMTYTQKQNTFEVHHIEIAYAGPPLPQPTPQQLLDISNDRRMKALAQLSNGQTMESIPLLEQHLQENPNDAEAHYALGVAYQQGSHMNEAIAQYKMGLANAGNNSDVTNKCVTRLQALQVIPDPNEQVSFHNLALKHHGQGLSEDAIQSTTSKGDLIRHNQPLSSAPTGPLPFNGPSSANTPVPANAPNYNALSPTNVLNNEAGAFPSGASQPRTMGINPGF